MCKAVNNLLGTNFNEFFIRNNQNYNLLFRSTLSLKVKSLLVILDQ